MREIKFRGKRSDGKGWAYGAYRPSTVPGKVYIAEKVGTIHEVDPETVGQYVGYDDIYKVGIHDGDEVEFGVSMLGGVERRKALVRWAHERTAWVVIYAEGSLIESFGGVYSTALYCQATGENIHDDPGLKGEYRYERVF